MDIPDELWEIILSQNPDYMTFKICMFVNKQLQTVVKSMCSNMEIIFKVNMADNTRFNIENSQLVHQIYPTIKWTKANYVYTNQHNCLYLMDKSKSEFRIKGYKILSNNLTMIIGILYIKIPLLITDIFSKHHTMLISLNPIDYRYYVAYPKN